MPPSNEQSEMPRIRKVFTRHIARAGEFFYVYDDSQVGANIYALLGTNGLYDASPASSGQRPAASAARRAVSPQ